MEDLQNILVTLKNVIEDSDSISKDDANFFSFLLKNLRTEIHRGLFEQLLSENADFDVLSSSIQAKIDEYTRELDKAKEIANNSLITYESKKAKTLERLIGNLQNIKAGIDKKDAVKACVDAFKNNDTQHLIDLCTSSLALGYFDFDEYYGKPLVVSHARESVSRDIKLDFDIVEKISDVIMKKEYHEDLLKYYDAVLAYDRKTREIADVDEKLKYLNVAFEYRKQLVELFTKKKLLAEYHQSLIDLKESINEARRLKREEEEKTRVDVLHRILLTGEFSRVKKMIEYYEREIEKRQQKYDNRLREMKELKSDIDIMGINLANTKELQSFVKYKLANEDGKDTKTNEAVPSIVIKALLNEEKFTDSIQIMHLEFKEMKEKLKAEQDILAQDKQVMYDELPDGAKIYADDIYSTRRAINILSRDKRGDKTPAIGLLILRAIVESKKISWDKLKEIVEIVSDVNVEDISKEYEDVMSRYLQDQKSKFEYEIIDYDRRTKI